MAWDSHSQPLKLFLDRQRFRNPVPFLNSNERFMNCGISGWKLNIRPVISLRVMGNAGPNCNRLAPGSFYLCVDFSTRWFAENLTSGQQFAIRCKSFFAKVACIQTSTSSPCPPLTRGHFVFSLAPSFTCQQIGTWRRHAVISDGCL
jgi:hypothetical protein